MELGYNFEGFSDNDFSAARRSVDGVYFSIRLKFDETTAGRVKKALTSDSSGANDNAFIEPVESSSVEPAIQVAEVETVVIKPPVSEETFESKACSSGKINQHYVQIIAYLDKLDAQQKLSELNLENASIESYKPDDSGLIWYRIVLGPFDQSKEALQLQARRFEAILGESVWIRKVDCSAYREAR